MPQRDIELMPEKKVLDFKLPLPLEQVGDDNANQVEEREHHV
jgi:hypothetical protein